MEGLSDSRPEVRVGKRLKFAPKKLCKRPVLCAHGIVANTPVDGVSGFDVSVEEIHRTSPVCIAKTFYQVS
jgi:hypothetical protein